MENKNKILQCRDCQEDFVFTEVDQAFFAEHKYAEPKRCLTCRKARRNANPKTTTGQSQRY